MIFGSLKMGWRRAWAAKRMLAIYYLASLISGLVLAVPLRSLLSEKISQTLLGDALGGRFDMDFFADFITNFPDFGDTWFGLAMIVPLFYLLSNIFFSGGALSVFASEEKYSATLFWSGAARYFGRFLRLWLMALPVFGIFFLIIFLEKGATRLLFGDDPYQSVTYWTGWVKTGLMALALILSHMYFDYARIHAVMHDDAKMRHAWLAGLKFVFGNLSKTLGLVLLMSAISVAGLVLYNLVADRLFAPSAVVVLLLVLWQQAYMIFRMHMKLTAFAAQTAFYQTVSAAPALAAGEPSVAESSGGLPEGLPASPIL